MPTDADLAGAVPSAPVGSVAEVLAAMAAIQGAVDADDGVGWFNRLYWRTTQNIAAALDAGRFVDAAFTARLDVVFANYYFGALRAFLAPGGGANAAPRAWTPLFERRADRDVAPIQFALAGMNAHIDRDLSFALVDVAREAGAFPARSSDAHADYEQVNDILAATELEVKPAFEGALLARVDRVFGRVEDVVALWSVRQAREAAWLRAEAQWEVRDATAASDALGAVIDRAAALATRALLIPTGRAR